MLALHINILLIGHLSVGAFVLGWLAKWQNINLRDERKKYAWTWHWRYLFCLVFWPYVAWFVMLQNISVNLAERNNGGN